MIKKHRIRISIFILIYIQSFRRIEYTFVKYNSYKTLILANDLSIKCDLDPGCRRASKAMAYGWASYTSQFPTLIVNNIDMLNLFKSRILQSFLNFLIGAVVEDCGVFITTVFCGGLDGEFISYHWRYIL